MSELLVAATEYAVMAIDAIALVIVVAATLRAVIAAAPALVAPLTGQQRREIWLHYTRWLVASLTFQLGADIVETAVATDWQSIARLGAIAVIRTFLNYFLERDMAETRELQHRGGAEAARPEP